MNYKKHTRVIITSLILLSLVLFSFSVSEVYAANQVFCKNGAPSETPDANKELYTALGCVPVGDTTTFLVFVVKRALVLGGGFTFLLLIYSSFMYTTSKGDPKKVAAAKDTFTASLSGLLLIMFSALLLRVVGQSVLNIPGL